MIRETVAWVVDDYEGPFSFSTICAVFHMDHKLVREAIFDMMLRKTDNPLVRRLIWQQRTRIC